MHSAQSESKATRTSSGGHSASSIRRPGRKSGRSPFRPRAAGSDGQPPPSGAPARDCQVVKLLPQVDDGRAFSGRCTPASRRHPFSKGTVLLKRAWKGKGLRGGRGYTGGSAPAFKLFHAAPRGCDKVYPVPGLKRGRGGGTRWCLTSRFSLSRAQAAGLCRVLRAPRHRRGEITIKL